MSDDAKMIEIAKERADWLVDGIAVSTQNRMFLRGDPKQDEVAIESILLCGEKAIITALMRYRDAHAAG